MPESSSPPARIHRVTTRRRTLRPLDCPLDSELLVAEFSGELPPDVALAVQEHMAVCALCGTRAQTLRQPYDLLAKLGGEPVPYVPDLRESVYHLSRSRRALRAITRVTLALGRGGTLALTGISGLLLLVLLVALVVILPARAQLAGRSTNGLSSVAAAGASGVLYAETEKIVPVIDAQGHQWQSAEVIAVSEHTGGVLRSMPQSSQAIHTGNANELPVAVALANANQEVVQLTAPKSDGTQALIAFDAQTGAVKVIVPIAVPGGASTPRADALAVSPDGKYAYVGLDTTKPAHDGMRVLVVNLTTGKPSKTLAPAFSGTIPMPPPPGSLPSSAFPSVIPHLEAGGYSAALGLGGALVISPDGKWLFDSLALTGPKGEHYLVVRRFDAATGKLAQELGLQGDFTMAQMAASPDPHSAEVYIAQSSPNAELNVLSADTAGPILIGQVPLGGPLAPENATFTGTLQILPNADGTRVFVGQDIQQTNGPAVGHDLWDVDTQGMGLLVHRTDGAAAGVGLLNGAGTTAKNTFILRQGEIDLISADLSKNPVPWLRLSDGHSVVALLGIEGSPTPATTPTAPPKPAK